MSLARVVSWITLGAMLATGGVFAALRTSDVTHAETFMTDAQGRAIIASGFSTAGSAKGSPSGLPDITAADIDQEYADMGTNFVRFLISWRAVEPAPGEYDTAYLDGVAERVGWYAERGYHVMLDMHQDLWGVDIVPGTIVGNGAPGWATYMDGLPVGENDQWELYYLEPGVIRAFDNFWNVTGAHPELTDHYAGAWRAVAERFAENPTVIAYDLMNEPYGGTMHGPIFEAGPLTALYQKTADAIREVDPHSWLCLEPQALGFNWGLPTALGSVTDAREGDARIAFCPHLYPLPMDLGDGYAGDAKPIVEGTIEAWKANTLRTAVALGDAPIILGEFGLDTNLPGALDYVRDVYRAMDEMAAGVVYWSRDNGSWGPYEADGNGRNLIEAIDRPYPRAVAGTPTGWASGQGLLQLTFVVDPAITAPTEVYLPRAGFSGTPIVTGAKIVDWDAGTRILRLSTPEGSGPVTVEITGD